MKGAARGMKRCAWSNTHPLMIAYHDTEWGVPVHDDRKLFEFLVLDAMQAGLSWAIILKKRENFRKALHGFDPAKVARYTARDLRRLLSDPGIVRNRLKLESVTTNARKFLDAQEAFGSFDAYIWKFAGSTICYAFMQAAGMVNDHVVDCFRYREVSRR